MAAKRHGLSDTPIHKTWMGMRSRCYNPSTTGYQYYGKRGIKVCDRWRDSFDAFYADMGDRPSPKHSIERIDVDGDYCPENCKWATPLEQAQNTTRNRRLTFEGKTQCLSAWCDELGLNYSTTVDRLRNGWTPEKALQPENFGIRSVTYKGKTQSIKAWADEAGLGYSTARARLRKGWSPEETFETPVGCIRAR